MFVETLSSISAAVINQGRRRKLHWDGCPNFRIWIIRNQKKNFVKLVEVKKKRQQEGNLYKSESHCLGSRRPGVRHRLAGATSHKNGETLSGAEKIEGMT